MHVWYQWRPEGGVGLLGLSGVPCGCWESNLCPLESCPCSYPLAWAISPVPHIKLCVKYLKFLLSFFFFLARKYPVANTPSPLDCIGSFVWNQMLCFGHPFGCFSLIDWYFYPNLKPHPMITVALLQVIKPRSVGPPPSGSISFRSRLSTYDRSQLVLD